jgi:phosphoribosylformimino-5-aminoimidazole carboxamide ribotide isomerase
MMPTIQFIPAIDLLDGKVVRLHKGDRAQSKVYADDPAKTTTIFRFESAGLLHVVDLDAAFDGPGARQKQALKKIVEAAKNVPVQLGGGLRDFETVEEAFALGISRVILGTAAVEQPELAPRIIEKYGFQRVAVAIDEQDGIVKTHGWTAGSGLDAVAFAVKCAELGVKLFLHSAIVRDGTLEGPDIFALRKIADAVAPMGGFVLCAGGIGRVEDLVALREAEIANLVGAISGRALYERVFTLPQARRALEGPRK